MPTATVTSKGQVTIPAAVRRALGLDAGDKIDFFETERGQFAIRPRTGSILEMRGIFPKLGYTLTIQQMDHAVQDAVKERYLARLLQPDSDAGGPA